MAPVLPPGVPHSRGLVIDQTETSFVASRSQPKADKATPAASPPPPFISAAGLGQNPAVAVAATMTAALQQELSSGAVNKATSADEQHRHAEHSTPASYSSAPAAATADTLYCMELHGLQITSASHDGAV